jgi:hypothetical protein
MYLLSQKSGPSLISKLIVLLASFEKTVARWDNPDVVKELYDSVPRESTMSNMYYKRYLELTEPEALAEARACRNPEELQRLIQSVPDKSRKEGAYCFVEMYEKVEQDALAKAQACTSEKEILDLLRNCEPCSIEKIIYELRWMELHVP